MTLKPQQTEVSLWDKTQKSRREERFLPMLRDRQHHQLSCEIQQAGVSALLWFSLYPNKSFKKLVSLQNVFGFKTSVYFI